MKVYLVGGAVRDELLGIPVKEKDWVVVNSSHKEMTNKGFKQIGKNFPVYLHAETKEEYALARKETKVGKGHKDFNFDINPKVSLREDLKRRDITINAIAKDLDGNFFDPYKGMEDLKNRKIRIVSDAFYEDPLRVFRVARFKTKLADFNFSITKKSLVMLRKMSAGNEIDFLSGERIWDETRKALKYKNSSYYFSTLKRIDALKYLKGIEKVYSENLKYLKKLDETEDRVSEKWAVINLGSKEVEFLEKKIRVPKKITNFRKIFNNLRELIKQKNLDAENILFALNSMNFFRNDISLLMSLNLLKDLKIISIQKFNSWNLLLKKLKESKITTKNLKPNEIKNKLFLKRIKIIEENKND